MKTKMAVFFLGMAVLGTGQSAQAQIFTKQKWERGVISGNRNQDRFGLVFSGSLQMVDMQVSSYSIKADFNVENYECHRCRFPEMENVLVKIEDDHLQEKLAQVKAKQYDDFGELIRLQSSTIEISTATAHQSFAMDCWAETKVFYSQKLNRDVHGFALACDHVIGDVHVWGDTYFIP